MRSKFAKIVSAPFLFVSASILFAPVLGATISGTYITTSDAPLRSGPGVTYGIVTTLPKGIRIEVVDRQGYWLKVESTHGRVPGYIDEQFAEPEGNAGNPSTKAAIEPAAGLYRTLADVELRQGPGANYPVVARLPSGMKVNVVDAEGDWLRIESKHGANPGYLERNSVERLPGD